jgi:hypothetical protein
VARRRSASRRTINLDGHQFDNLAYDGTPHPARPLTDPQHWGHRAATGGYLAAGDWVGFDYYLWPDRPELWFIHERLLDRTWDWGGTADPALRRAGTVEGHHVDHARSSRSSCTR